MGTFAKFVGKKWVPPEKCDEFSRCVMTILCQAGMMQREFVTLYDRELCLLCLPEWDEGGKVWVEYNYFEDDVWEPAGYCAKTNEVWSQKVGTHHFCKVICALYLLYEFYGAPGFATVNRDLVRADRTAGWFNYLFHTNYVTNPPFREEIFRDEADQYISEVAKELHTAEFLSCNNDDRVYWWRKEEDDVCFSLEMKAWITELRQELHEILEKREEQVASKEFLKVFATLLLDINRDFGHIYAFRDMFYDFLAHSDHREYQAAVVLLQRLADRCREEGAVIHTISNWTLGDLDIKHNTGRMRIKRYLALLANEMLRAYLFGHTSELLDC